MGFSVATLVSPYPDFEYYNKARCNLSLTGDLRLALLVELASPATA